MEGGANSVLSTDECCDHVGDTVIIAQVYPLNVNVLCIFLLSRKWRRGGVTKDGEGGGREGE